MGSFDDTVNRVFKQLLGEADKKPSKKPSKDVEADKTIPDNVLTVTKNIINESKGELSRKDSMLFNILQDLIIHITREVDTMAVNNKRDIYINPEFTIMMYNRNPQEVVGVLAHETMHHANDTFLRLKGKDMKMWNVATDFIMNMYLLDSGFVLPEEGCIPVLENKRWWIKLPVAEGLSEEQAKQIREGSTNKNQAKTKVGKDGRVSEIDLDITNVDADQLYYYLKNVLPKKENKTIIYLPETLDDHIKGDPGAKKEGKEGEEGKEGQKIIKGDPGAKKEGEEGDDEETESEKAEREKLREIVLRAKIAATHEKNTFQGGNDKSNSRSGVSRQLVKDWEAPGIDWRRILRKFVQDSTDVEYSNKIYNKRADAAGFFAPGEFTPENQIEATIAVDCSGSISDTTVRKFVGSVIQMAAQHTDYKFRVILYSDNIIKHIDPITHKEEGDILITPQTLTKAKQILNQIKIISGGNNENCIKEYLKLKNIKKVNGFLLLTDGWVDPKATYIDSVQKRLFLIIKGGTDEHLKKHGDIKFVNIDDK